EKGARAVVRNATDQAFARSYDLGTGQFQEVRFAGRPHSIFRPESTLGQHGGLFNVQSDEELLASLLRRLRKMDPVAAEGLTLTKKLFDEYLSALRVAGFIGEERLREEARAGAVKELIHSLDDSALSTLLDGEEFFALPKVQAAVKARVDTEVENLRGALE